MLDRARALIGVPWVHQGRDPATGVDCVGLLAVLFPERRGHDRAGYGRDPHAGELEAGMRAAFGEPVADPRPGDVVVMRGAGAARHVGILGSFDYGDGVEHLTLLHADSRVGKVVEQRLDPKARRLIVAAFRPEVAA